MTGFIRGLFGGKKDKEPSDKGAFFLSSDDAKSFGNIDYMRSSKTVRRTFAKKKGVTEELESVRQISAMDSSVVGETRSAEEPSQVVSNGKVESAPKFTRRSADSNLDMFRNMARDMKKK